MSKKALTPPSRKALHFLTKLPVLWLGYPLSGLAGLYSRLPTKENHNLSRNIEEIFALPRHSIFHRQFRRQVWQSQVFCALETLSSYGRDPEVHGEDNLATIMAAAAKNHSSVVVMTGHLGCWELAGAYAGRHLPTAFHVLAKPPKQRFVRSFLHWGRQYLKMKVLWTEDNRSLIKRMFQTMKRGESLGFVMDQKPQGRNGIDVPFWGRMTPFVRGPAMMAARFSAPMVSVYCLRLGPGELHLRTRQLTTGQEGYDERKLTEIMAADLEEVMKLYPEQWAWNYKRWTFKEVSAPTREV